MSVSSPSFTGFSELRRPAVRPLGAIGTIILGLVLVLVLYFVGLKLGLLGHAMFDGGR